MDEPNGSKTKRKAISIQQKVDIIRDIEKGMKQCDVAKKWKRSETTISTIFKNRVETLAEWVSGNAKRKRLKTSNFEQLDSALLKWFTQQRLKGVSITAAILQEKSLEFAKSLNIEGFKGSVGFINRLKKRHGVVCKVINGEKL